MKTCMTLIRTHDGMLGWNLNGKTTLCESKTELINIGWHHISPRVDKSERIHFTNEVNYACDEMRKSGDTLAEFGIFGTFMFTTVEEDL